MIAIINYDNEEVALLKSMLQNEVVDENIKITDSEDEICHASKIILPDTSNIRPAVRMIHFHNFSSLLRLIKKPVLGINSGAAILSESIVAKAAIGLGLFTIKVDCPVTHFSSLPKVSNQNLSITKNTNLLNGIDAGDKYFFNNKCLIDINEFTTSTYHYEGKEYSATIEKANYYGMLFNPYRSGEAGIKILKNFISL